jgi:hypothetical protein
MHGEKWRMVQKSDPYLKKIDKYWNEIIAMYLTFHDKRPIIEFDPNRIRILACPADEYLDVLSDRTRDDAKNAYREASAIDSIMLFVRDEKKKVLRSYIFPRSDFEEVS